METAMRSVNVVHAHGPPIPRGPGPPGWGLSSIDAWTARRGYPEPRRGPKRVEQGRKPSVVRRLNAAPEPTAAPPVATSNGINPSADRGGPVGVLRTVGHAATSLHSIASVGFAAAWLMVGVLLLALAVISAVSDPPRLPSEDELARASTRVAHERAVPERR